MGLLHELNDGKKREITAEDFEHFLNVLPPVAMPLKWKGERWAFGFAEGFDSIYAFRREGGRFYAQKTDLLNPLACGRSVEEQQRPGFIERLKAEQDASRTAAWTPTWLKLGKQNPFIRRASDPPFTLQSFQPCLSDDELFDRFERGNCCLGQAFWRGDLCFINQVAGGDEWLAIKQDVPFESISFGKIIHDRGRPAAQELLDRLRTASVERCRALSY